MKIRLVTLSLIAAGMAGFASCGTTDQGSAVQGVPSVVLPAPAIVLDGKIYSRTVKTGGLFGQPAGERKHTLAFHAGNLVEDNANTFFGNPPETSPYELQGRDVVILRDGAEAGRYSLSEDGNQLLSAEGALLTLEAAPDAADEAIVSDLEADEISSMIDLFDRVHVPVGGSSACTVQTAEIQSNVRSFNPAKWTISFDGKTESLTADEKTAMVKLFSRLDVRAESAGIDLKSKATIESRVCGFSPARWTAKYLKAE
jgi:hypothetical protein